LKHLLRVAFICVLTLSVCSQTSFRQNDLFVATNGDVSWTGRLPEPKADKSDGPLPSIQAAKDRLRHLLETEPSFSTVTVWIRGGSYPVYEPLNFDAEDSGVTYAAYPGEQPVIDGGMRVKNWSATKLHGATVWVADLKDLPVRRDTFRSFFVNGQRRPRTRLPREGFYHLAGVPGRSLGMGGNDWLFDGADSIRVKASEIKNWKNLGEVDVRIMHFWTEERLPVKSVDEASGVVKLQRSSVFVLQDGFTNQWAEYWIENVFEALGGEPGEWYFDSADRKLYYVPMPGETISNIEAVLPMTYQFVRINGVPEDGHLVEDVVFKGLTFQYADWFQPEENGTYFDPYVPEENWRRRDSSVIPGMSHHGLKLGGTPQSAIHVPGAISLVGAHQCGIVGCRIAHVGYFGINLADGCQRNLIEANTIEDMGGGGIKIDGAEYPSAPVRFSGKNWLTDNVIRTGGRVFMTAPGIIVTHGFGNMIAHNEISDLYQIGISVGWRWFREHTVSRDNRIEYNHIFHLGQKISSDMGGIYTLGVQPGTMIRNNLIHDVQHRQYGGWGIYTDSASANLVVENNVVYDVSAQSIIVNAVDDSPTNREIMVRNNIFALGNQGEARIPENYLRRVNNIPGKAATYLNNIFINLPGRPTYVAEIGPVKQHPHNDIFFTDLNLVWDSSGKPPLMNREEEAAGREKESQDLEAWRTLGNDQHSLVADPKVRNLDKRDFTLLPDSPAFELGFEPIDLSQVGPRSGK
jgi:hypothetical protein